MGKYNLLVFLIQFIDVLRNIFIYAIIGRVILSWFSMGKGKPTGRLAELIYEITNPVINFVRKMPHTIGMIDLSPLIALFGIDILAYVVISALKFLLV